MRCALLLLTALALPVLAEVKEGDIAPPIRLRDQDDKPRDVAETYGSWTALIFYPRDDTSGCTAEACSVRDSWPAFEAAGVKVFGISVDAVGSKAAWDAKYNLQHVLLADVEKSVCQAYGTLTDRGFSARVTFLLDPARIVRYINRQVSPQQAGPNILAKIEELRAADAQAALGTLGPATDSPYGFRWAPPAGWAPTSQLPQGPALTAGWVHPQDPRLMLLMQVVQATDSAVDVAAVRGMLPAGYAPKVIERVWIDGEEAVRGYAIDPEENQAANGFRFLAGDRAIALFILSPADRGDAAARLAAAVATSIAID